MSKRPLTHRLIIWTLHKISKWIESYEGTNHARPSKHVKGDRSL